MVEEEEECLWFDADSCNIDGVIHREENTTDCTKSSCKHSCFEFEDFKGSESREVNMIKSLDD